MEWQEDAECKGHDISLFYREDGDFKEAVAICGDCDVKRQCLSYALSNKERFGVWGGTTERERRLMMSKKYN